MSLKSTHGTPPTPEELAAIFAPPQRGPMRVRGFQPQPPTVHPPMQYADLDRNPRRTGFRLALDEHNDRDWLSDMLEDAEADRTLERQADDLRAARGVLMPIAIFLALGLGVTVGMFIGKYWWH